jgi:hypothetical protein
LQTPIGAQLNENMARVTSLIERLSSQERGTAEHSRLVAQANTLLDAMDKAIASRLPIATGVTATGLRDASVELQSFRQQIRAATTASAAETKADETARNKADAAARKAERDVARGPALSQSYFDQVLRGVVGPQGMRLGSGPRSAEEQDRLFRMGVTRATSKTSQHSTGGIVRDIPTGPIGKEAGDRLAETIRSAFKALGITVIAKWKPGGPGQGTGPHVHVEALRGQHLKGGLGQDPGDAEFDQQAKIDQAQLELDRADMANKLKAIAQATTRSAFDSAVVGATDALNKVNKDLMDTALNELAKSGIGQGHPLFEAKKVQQAIDQNIETFQRALADSLIKQTEALIQAAQTRFDMAVAPSARALSIMQGAESGLSRYSLRGRVSDSTTTLAQARTAQAQEVHDRTRLAALPTQIASTQAAINQLTVDSNNPLLSPDTVARMSLSIQDLQNKLEGLKATRDSLQAAFGVEGLIPGTLQEGLDQAMAAYAELNNLNLSFTQMVNNEMLGAINTLHGALVNMFTSIMDGSRNALQAIGDFAKAIMAAILQIVAKIIATKIIKLLFSIFGGTPPVEAQYQGGEAGSGGSQGYVGPPAFNGRAVRGYAGGSSGPIINGHSMRDNVLSKLAKGEWVIRKAAVDSVGHEFMNRLNRQGAGALRDMQAMPKLEMKPQQEVNVWMIKPEEKPQMGPNDVIVAWQSDVLSGGESRRLIKRVAREG